MVHFESWEARNVAKGSQKTPELCPQSHKQDEIVFIIHRVGHWGSWMDDDFYRERARQIREVAAQADPFIKKRLLRLAGNYDAMITRTKPAASSNVPEVSPDNFAENNGREKG